MTYIFEVKLKPGHTAEQYATVWIKVSEVLQRAPGALGTRLHRKLGDSSRLLAIATWESKAHRDAMEAHRDPAVHAFLKEASEHCEINIIGEFDSPQWVVEPPTRPCSS
jgi:quinol monooxygenase YgiN